MKFKFGSFLAGVLCAALIGGLTVSALAITGKTTIEVYPINVMVNGEVFQPTDAQGNPVDIFTYDGTTYAPLRALATAYGLEVGYDAEKKLATVTDPSKKKPEAPEKPDYSNWSAEEEAAYQEFKAMWEMEESRLLQEQGSSSNRWYYQFACSDDISNEQLIEIRDTNSKYIERMLLEYAEEVDEDWIVAYFHNEFRGFHFNAFKK